MENLEKQRNLTQYHKPAEINQRRDVGTYSINVEGKLYRQDIEQTTRKNNNIRYGWKKEQVGPVYLLTHVRNTMRVKEQ